MDQFTCEKTYIILEHMALMLEGNIVGALRLEQEKERRMYAAALREAIRAVLRDAEGNCIGVYRATGIAPGAPLSGEVVLFAEGPDLREEDADEKKPPAGEDGRRVMICRVHQGHSVKTVTIPVSNVRPTRKKPSNTHP